MTDATGRRRVPITQLLTGVPGLDEVLGGGMPEYAFSLIAGAPGTGKTTLAQQVMFALATPERPALHFTVLGEPQIKMLRYQQQFAFFDPDKVGSSVRYVHLAEMALQGDLDRVLDTIVREVEQVNPGIVVVDSFRTMVRAAGSAPIGEMDLQTFLQRLALKLTAQQATTFLVGEYTESDLQDDPVFTMADGILWLYQSVERNSSVRKLHVVKMRGQATLPGLHTVRITDAGPAGLPAHHQASDDRPAASPYAPFHRCGRARRDARRRHSCLGLHPRGGTVRFRQVGPWNPVHSCRRRARPTGGHRRVRGASN